MSGRRSLSVFSAAVAVAVAAVAPAPAQKADTEEVKFDSGDGVQLQGTLYKAVLNDKKIVAAKDVADCPCVILLHSPGADPNTGDWGGLAETLAGKGFHVLRFDFRGHGRSKDVDKLFWEIPLNAQAFPTLYKKKPLPTKIEWNDIKAVRNQAYFPYLVNDIIAARIMLDKRNDDGKLNTSSVYLIGATDAAPLGMLYMAAEWTRPQKLVEIQAKFLKALPADTRAYVYDAKEAAGRDVAGAIWLSPKAHPSVGKDAMKQWVLKWTEMRETPVICMAGDKDDAGMSMSRFIVDEMLVAKPKTKTLSELKFTFVKPAPGAKNVGVDLLGKQLKTEETIFKQLEDLEKDRTSVTKIVNRNFTTPPVVNVTAYGIK